MLTEKEFKKITSSVDDFNKFLEEFKREIYLAIPEITLKHIQDLKYYQEIVNDFYEQNPDLKSERMLIKSLANKIFSDDPSLTFEEVFKMAAEKAREVLKENKDGSDS